MSNDTAKTQTTNLLPVQGIFEPLYPYNCVTLIGPAGTPFTAPSATSFDGITITNSTINSTTIGLTTPAAAAFTTASSTNQPIGNNDLTTKLYVDSLALGISWKQPVLAATTTAITLSGAQTIDTVPVVAGDRVLVKDQGTASENGIYIVGTPWTRAPDANAWTELISALVFVESGSLAGTAWYCTAQPGGTLGSTAINWSNFSIAGTYFAGTGLTLSANTFSITNTGVTAGTYGSASKTLTAQVNAQGQLTSLSASDIAIGATQITSGTIDSARLSGTYSGITGLGTLTDLTVTNTISGSINGNAATATSATTATTATNLSGGASGSLPYQSAASTTAMLAKGTDGQYLTLASGLPAWTNLPADALTISADTANATRYPVFEQATSGSTSSLYVNTGYTFNPTTGKLSTVSWGGDYIDFNTGATVTSAVGRMYWNGSSTVYVGMTANVTGHVMEDQFYYVKASSAINKGQVAMFTGSVGASGVITVAPATGVSDGSYIVGIAAENIALNGFGLIQGFGVLRNINTTGYSDGDILWYDPSVTGGLTKTKPTAPNVKVQMAAVVNGGSSGGGVIQIRVNSGSVLGGTDSNVQFGTLNNNDVIRYNSTSQYWENVAQSSLSVGTATNLAGGAAGSLPYQSGAGATTFLAAGSDGQVLKLASGVPTWSSDASGVTISDDTTTNATRYLTFTSATTGNVTTEYVASTKLSFNPSTGILTATSFSGAGTGLTGTASGLSIGGNAATATSATSATNTTNIAITDDTTTNATMYPVWVTTNTGNLPAKVASTKLSFNPSTGVLSTVGANFSGLTASNIVATDASKNLTSVATTGSGSVVLATSPSLTTPNIGAATATTVNGLTISTTTGTLTVTNGKTLSVSNSLTLAGTDATTMTFPSSSATIAGLGIAQTWTAAQSFNSGTLKLNGSSSGTGILNAPAAASTYTWTLPAATDTLAAIGFAQTWTAAQTFNSGNLKLAGSSSGTATLNAPAAAGTNTYTLPPDACTLGYRNVPAVGTKTSSYTLATGDVGKYVQVGTSGSITIPDATFAEGDVVSIFNNTSGNITITCSITTAYISGTDTDKATMTLATRGIATVFFISSTVCVVSGSVT